MNFEERVAANKSIKRINNDELYAGSPMYFYCTDCGGEIVVPEDYRHKDSKCTECRKEGR